MTDNTPQVAIVGTSHSKAIQTAIAAVGMAAAIIPPDEFSHVYHSMFPYQVRKQMFPEKPKEMTAEDYERIGKAEEKRKRKALKRLSSVK